MPPPLVPPTERTPLVGSATRSTQRGLLSPLNRVYFMSLVIGITLSFTQSALIYSFRTMTCDEYYKTHTWEGQGDRCAIPAIDSSAASSIALMSTVTTTSTIVNLFTSAWFINRYGVKVAMVQQTVWAAFRNLTQIYAQTVGGSTGMGIIQTTQLFNILGSGGGLTLCSNSYVAMLSGDAERTANFGVLGGITMLGAGIGYTGGGLADRYISYLAPFQGAFLLLCFCTAFGMFFLPYFKPEGTKDGNKNTQKSGGFLGPMRVFAPRKCTEGNTSTRDWNLFFLGTGTFLSVLATGYVSMALQLVATNVFGFTPATSGMMLSLTLIVKAFFLSVCFPVIISRGRRWLSGDAAPASTPPTPNSPLLEHPEHPSEAEIPDAAGGPISDTAPPLVDARHGATFDLLFLRYSILLDGILTSMVTFAAAPWHMYLAASILPFASGTGPASKGVTLELVPPDERAEALSAIALVEKIAQVSTIALFGYVFALLSRLEHPTLVFVVDGGVAVLAFVLLLPVRMPRVSVHHGVA